jgi:ketosteroid isomerase-like protein
MTDAPAQLIRRFHDAFNAQDIDTVMQLMTEDCIFENTYPPPNGARYVGQQAVRQSFLEFFESSPHASFEIEELFACGDHGALHWTYHWRDTDQQPGHVRGVDIFTIRDHRIASKLSYVKG